MRLAALLPFSKQPRYFLERTANAEQLVFAEDDQAFIVRIVGQAHELDDFRIDRDFLAACVGYGDEGDHKGFLWWVGRGVHWHGYGSGGSMARKIPLSLREG
jgi:hypothetical protein